MEEEIIDIFFDRVEFRWLSNKVFDKNRRDHGYLLFVHFEPIVDSISSWEIHPGDVHILLSIKDTCDRLEKDFLALWEFLFEKR